MGNRATVLRRIEGFLERGDTDSQIKELPGFAAALDEPGDLEEKLRAKAHFAQVSLVLCERKRAARILYPYVNEDLSLNEGQVERLGDDDECSTLVRGMLLSAVGNYSYRTFEFDAGKRYARRAAELLAEHDEEDSVQRWLAERANVIWMSRLLWRSGERDEAEALLEKALPLLHQSLRRSSRIVGGSCLLTAIALSLWASFDWSRGRLKDAQRRIYRSISILRSGYVNDRIRLGTSLLMAGRVEATHSTSGFSWARFLLEESFEEFENAADELLSEDVLGRFKTEQRKPFEKGWKHPFGRRVLIQRSQCLIKARKLDEAKRVLQKAKDYPLDDVREDAFSSAEATLAELWILERRAEKSDEPWQSCVDLAKELIDRRDSLSERLKAEANLHYGLCLTRMAGPREHARCRTAREHLSEAVRIANQEGLPKIEAAAKFALAENLAESGEKHEARERFEEARALRSNLDSTLLTRIERLVAEKLDYPLPIEVNPRLQYKEAKEAFMRQYFEHHAQQAHTSRDLLDAVGLSQASVYRHFNKFGLAPLKRSEP